MRRLAARGVLINGAFDVGLTSLGLIKGFVVAAFLTREEFGVFGLLAAALGSLLWLKQVGIGDKYVQQRDEDQERAFQLAFTFELAASAVFLLLILAAVPVVTLVYGENELLAAGFVVSLTIVGNALQTPIWPHYRSMHFARQRTLQAIDPVVAFVVTVALAATGAGYWALVIGVVAGSFAGAAVAVIASPFALRLRWDGGVARSYLAFSWPLLVAGGAGIVISQSAVLVSEFSLGLAGVGAVALASSIVAYTGRVDQIVTNTLYPAICRIVDRRDALVEVFVKSNRLALTFGLPFGVGLALFAEPLVVDGLGPRWEPAVGLVQAFALVAAADQLFFNWSAFHRALGLTRPMAVTNVVMMVVFLCVAIPLLLAEGLDGLGIGMGATTLAGLALRSFYVRRIFPGVGLAPLAAKSAVPALSGAAVVLLADGPLAAEVAAYLAVVAVATAVLQGGLLREAAGYLARRSAAQSEPATRPA